MNPSIPLSPAQIEIVNAPADARCLVTAAPGTGKTHVLIARLHHLIEEQGLNPGQDILLLSFTRAAVYEIRQRLKDVDGDSRYAGAYTFDSFATMLLRRFARSDAWERAGYDDRIAAATQLILGDAETQEFIRDYRHLMVDEIQDLVSIRAFFVKAIIGCMDAGFSLFGDPAQGIYNFSVKDGEAESAHTEVVAWVRQVYQEELEDYTLTTSYRAKSPVAKGVLMQGRHLYEASPDYEQAEIGLQWLLEQMPDVDIVEQARKAAREPKNRTAILCRNNGQALWVSKYLHEAGIPHTYQRAATDRVLPAWLGAMFFDFPLTSVGRTTFMTLAGERFRVDDGDPDFAWHLLKRAARTHRDTVDLEAVARNIRNGGIPDEFIQMQHAALTVSTIHRAKGREFDAVIYAHDNRKISEPEQAEAPLAEAEIRVLYVALSRARRDIYRTAVPYSRLWRVKDKDTGRWTGTFMNKSLRMVSRVQIQGRDVHQEDPAGTWYRNGATPEELQRYLRDRVNPGDGVQLCFGATNGASEQTRYLVRHGDRDIGVSSESFQSELYEVLHYTRSWEVHFPFLISEAFIEGVDTVVGPTHNGAGVLNPFWLRPRIYGLAKLHHPKNPKSK